MQCESAPAFVRFVLSIHRPRRSWLLHLEYLPDLRSITHVSAAGDLARPLTGYTGWRQSQQCACVRQGRAKRSVIAARSMLGRDNLQGRDVKSSPMLLRSAYVVLACAVALAASF